MPQILQLRVNDSMMEAIAELGKRRYPSSLAPHYGGALGYDRLAVLQDILEAGLAALAHESDSPSTKATGDTPPPTDPKWVARLEALEREVAALKAEPARSSQGATGATSSESTAKPTAAKQKAEPPKPDAPKPDGKAKAALKSEPATPASAKSTAKKATAKTSPTPSAAPSQSSQPQATQPPKQPAKSAKSAKSAISTSTTTSRVKKAKTPSRRRRSSSSMSKAEIDSLTQADSLSKNGLASLCRCDKRTLDRKREEGDLGKFTRARCGIEYRYKDSDSRYYPVKS